MDLIVTPAHHNANSYITLGNADTYLFDYDRLASSNTWEGLTDDQQRFALSIAASALNAFNYKGKPVTQTQNLAFPRYTWYQINQEGKSQYKNFFKATQDLITIVEDGEIAVSNNRLVDQSSSADAFYQPLLNEKIDINQVIKVTGLSTNKYLTIKDIDTDGSYIATKESISSESAPSGGVKIEATPIFGVPAQVGQAQVEIAIQVIDSEIFQSEIGTMPEPMPASFDLGGTLSVRYANTIMSQSKFSKDKTSPIDIVYYLLSPWLSSVGGGVV